MQSKMTILALTLALGGGWPSARADSVPMPACGAISSRVIEVRTDGDLSNLTERERTNLTYYLNHLKATGEQASFQVFLFRGTLPWGPELRLSLIFPSRGCDQGKCIGTAVLPGEQGIELKAFSYRKNMIAEPYRGSTKLFGEFHERNSTSYIFMDEKERYFIAFNDVWRLPSNVQWTSLTLKQAQPVRSEARMLSLKRQSDQPARRHYPLCFKNMFEAEGIFPYT